MSTRMLAVPTAPRRFRVRTATPGGMADYAATTSDRVTLVGDLAAYGEGRSAERLAAGSEGAAWTRLADLATAGF